MADKTQLLVSDSCCGSKPLPASVVDLKDFKPKGKNETLGDLPIYVVKPEGANPDIAIICIYDILGHGHPNNTQAADILATKTNCIAVLPDVFRGVPFPPSRFAEPIPPGEEGFLGLSKTLMNEIVEWSTVGNGSWGKVVKKDIDAVCEYLHKHGVKKIGIVGFCYGGLICGHASMETEAIHAAVGIHPSFLSIAVGEKIKNPFACLPAQDDPIMDDFVEALEKNPKVGKDKVLHHRYTDVPHGFCTARGDYTDALIKQRADEAFEETSAFLLTHLA